MPESEHALPVVIQDKESNTKNPFSTDVSRTVLHKHTASQEVGSNDSNVSMGKKYNRVKHYPGKRIKKILQENSSKLRTALDLTSAVKILKTFPPLKFDQTVELIFHLGIDPKQDDQRIRGSLSLPNGIGKRKKVVAFCPDELSDTAIKAGAIDAGLDALIRRISEGWSDFEVAVATPDVMPKIAKLGRILGPQGKMPNPKSGTVTTDVANAVKEHVEGKVQLRCDTGANVHAVIGKYSFPENKLIENAVALIDYIRKLKPASAKGQYIKSAYIKATMTPAISLELIGQ